MSRFAFTLLMLPALTVWTGPAAADWSLGAHLGAGVITSDVKGSGSSSMVALASNVLTYQPSLRIAVGTTRHGHSVALDTGFLFLEEGGASLRMLLGTLSYQYAFRPDWHTSPIASAGLGLYHEGSEVRASTNEIYTLGLGVRRVIRDEHGALRAELRWERLRADDRTGRPKLTTLGVRLGFDLWM